MNLLERVPSSERAKMPASYFGLPNAEDPKKSKYPMKDAKHVKYAIGYFNDAPSDKQKELADNIIRRYKELGLQNSDKGPKVHPGNQLYDMVPDFMKADEEIQELTYKMVPKTNDEIALESVEDLKKNLTDDNKAILEGMNVRNYKQIEEGSYFVTESIDVEDPKFHIVSKILAENTHARMNNIDLVYPVIYGSFPIMLEDYDEAKANGGIDALTPKEDVYSCYDNNGNMYPAQGMMDDDLDHITFAQQIQNFASDYMQGVRNMETDMDVLLEWKKRVNDYHKELQEATTDNDKNKAKQKLYDIRWNPEATDIQEYVQERLVEACDYFGITHKDGVEITENLYIVNDHKTSIKVIPGTVFEHVGDYEEYTKPENE